jgi:nitroimidazol reductase NimA-like FMN-containing flavoprotein (pyridoxamine 5'-phosphate oxidase superfamily)
MTDRTKLHRRPQRGAHDRETLDAILDEALVAHVGFIVERQPYVLPMAFVRVDDAIYVHGSRNNRMLDAIVGRPVGVTVTMLDGLVLAKSAFHHSMNYRSAVILGEGADVADERVAAQVFDALLDRMSPLRSRVARSPTAAELAATRMVRVPLHEFSCKIRQGPPIDDEADLSWDAPSGVIALQTRRGPLA